MEKVTEFLKKNWVWILIAVVVITYLLTRKKKTESNYKVGVAKNLAGRIAGTTQDVSFPEAIWSKPGWFELRGSGYAWLKRNRPIGSAIYDYFTNGNGGTGRWSPFYSMPGAATTRNNLSFKFPASTKVFGYWYFDCRVNKTAFYVLFGLVGLNRLDFSGDTWVNGNCASPTNLDGGQSDMKVFPELILEGASLVRVG